MWYQLRLQSSHKVESNTTVLPSYRATQWYHFRSCLKAVWYCQVSSCTTLKRWSITPLKSDCSSLTAQVRLVMFPLLVTPEIQLHKEWRYGHVTGTIRLLRVRRVEWSRSHLRGFTWSGSATFLRTWLLVLWLNELQIYLITPNTVIKAGTYIGRDIWLCLLCYSHCLLQVCILQQINPNILELFPT